MVGLHGLCISREVRLARAFPISASQTGAFVGVFFGLVYLFCGTHTDPVCFHFSQGGGGCLVTMDIVSALHRQANQEVKGENDDGDDDLDGEDLYS